MHVMYYIMYCIIIDNSFNICLHQLFIYFRSLFSSIMFTNKAMLNCWCLIWSSKYCNEIWIWIYLIRWIGNNSFISVCKYQVNQDWFHPSHINFWNWSQWNQNNFNINQVGLTLRMANLLLIKLALCNLVNLGILVHIIFSFKIVHQCHLFFLFT